MASVRKRTWTSRGEIKTAWVADYFDQSGTRRLKTFERKKDADGWLVDARGEVKRGVHTPESTSITVGEAADLWIEKADLDKLERSTLRQYRAHADLHIKPKIGAMKLAQLTAPSIESFRDELLKSGSRAMARKVLASLKGILGEAQRRGLIAHNPASAVRIDARRREQRKIAAGVDFPSKQEVQTMVAKTEGRWRPLLITAIFTGMRASELRGLTWNDVDFEERVIHVRQRANLWGEIGAPKSAAGARQIAMSPMVVNTLKEWRIGCPRLKQGEGEEGRLWFVFPAGSGKVESHANILNRGFYALQLAEGITKPDPLAGAVGADGNIVLRPKYGLHALRHFFASWAIEQGFAPKRLQVMLGHSSIQMTFDVYGHLFPNLEDDHAKLAAGELSLVG